MPFRTSCISLSRKYAIPVLALVAYEVVLLLYLPPQTCRLWSLHMIINPLNMWTTGSAHPVLPPTLCVSPILAPSACLSFASPLELPHDLHCLLHSSGAHGMSASLQASARVHGELAASRSPVQDRLLISSSHSVIISAIVKQSCISLVTPTSLRDHLCLRERLVPGYPRSLYLGEAVPLRQHRRVARLSAGEYPYWSVIVLLRKSPE